MLTTLVLRSLFLLAVSTDSAPAPAPLAPSRTPPTNEFGAPVRDTTGKRITYGQEELARQAAQHPRPPEFPGEGAQALLPPAPTPLHAYAEFGGAIGVSGLSTAVVGGRTEIYSENFTYWYAVARNATTGNYDMVYVSPAYPTYIVRVFAGNVRAEAGSEIVTLLSDGTVDVVSAETKQRLATFPSSVASPTAMRFHDLDGDGLAEIFVEGSNVVTAFDGAGSQVWTKNGVGGADLAIGNMDNDPSLEVATADGKVTDVATGTIQCTWAAGFGYRMAVSDFDGDGQDELIFAEPWGFCWAFDVDTCLPKWSLPVFNIGAIDVVDVDGNGTDELIIGDAQWGDIHAHSLVTQQLLWSIHNPEHGTTWITVADVDADGQREVMWGAGATSSGSDRLYVGNPVAQSIEWENIQLEGPFLGPRVGDVDGDGDLEVVSVSTSSDADYGSGRIVVLDAQTFAVQAISQEIMQGFGWTGIHDIQLRNVDADPALEIVTAGDRLYDGLIEIYDYAPTGAFPLLWDNNTLPSGSPFTAVDVADIDGDGQLEVVGGNGVAHSGSPGIFAYIYDFATGNEEWHTFHLGGGPVTGLVLANTDSDPALEIHAMLAGGSSYVFDGATHGAEDMIPGNFRCLEVQPATPSASSIVWLGDDSGQLNAYRWNGTDYILRHGFQVVAGALQGFSFGRLGSVYVTRGDTLSQIYPLATGTLRWSLSGWGSNLGRHVTRVPSVPMVVTANEFAVLAFQEP